MENKRVSYFYVNVTIIFISYCGITLILFSHALFCVVQVYGMVGAGVLRVPTLGDGAMILRSTLGGAGVSTLGGAGSNKNI